MTHVNAAKPSYRIYYIGKGPFTEYKQDKIYQDKWSERHQFDDWVSYGN